jgi:SpoVK/Ycf46/Vps4 family AAA+-type ATPase
MAFITDGRGAAVAEINEQLHRIEAEMDRPPALVTLRDAFGLSSFEQDVLMLCAGVAIEADLRRALAEGRGLSAPHAAPTFGLALAILPAAHWSALTPASPLRRWSLVECGPGAVVTECPLHASERVLHHLAGVHYTDQSLGIRPVESVPELPPGQAAVAREAVTRFRRAKPGCPPAIQLLARRRDVGNGVAACIADSLGLTAAILRAEDVPAAVVDRLALARRVEREAVLTGLLPVLDCGGMEGEQLKATTRLADELAGPVVLACQHPLELSREDARFAIPAATPGERLEVWNASLGPLRERLNGQAAQVAELFDLDPAAIRVTAADFSSRVEGHEGEAGLLLWELARARARPRLEHLTELVSTQVSWEMLVLPDAQGQTVREIAAHARWRGRVYREWGFGRGNARGLGISALFSGPSGTGKSMAAEAIACELGLDLYRIDLSRVVSKYIGETERNLGNVFDEAEGAGAILLFDEADALFGKRSEVKDSHDRYANLEISYLLQRMETYDGLAILTTNQRGALDPAFLRRIRFVVQFPFPDAAARAEIWKRVFPPEAPTDGLAADLLARLNVAGGNIRNMALNAAFHAAADGAPVRMEHVLLAARSEFAKLERPLPEAEVRGWR